MIAAPTRLISALTGRLPIGWLQLSHSRGKMIAAISGVAFADILVFVQLGILGALNQSTIAPYDLFRADIIISSADANTLTDGSNVARSRMFQALGVPGVKDATPLYLANLEWQREDGDSSTLQTFGISPDKPEFTAPDVADQIAELRLEDRVLLDRQTRGLPAGALDHVSSQTPYSLELNGTSVWAVGTLEVGGGFSADGTLYVSDQTFLELFGNRASGAPNHILVSVDDGIDPAVVVERLREALPTESVKVAQKAEAAAADLAYQTTERPTGVIFGFGVAIGIVVGLVIVYQVLSTDVADHLREYATFKAIGYPQRFFLGIVLEEAVILALFGFIPAVAIAVGLYAAMSAATGLPLSMDVARAMSVLIGTLAACALSGALATRRLASADPADLF
ncbi:ABC transporter permease DevC [Cognatiyoonia sp. IB215446]|uniref:ABC transporter permease DevC n=1 Tax=Cognatiyoonia sp. IB215446 TaxID=3097355 RepID=UPI002A1366B3|nr:ABC transporter permease DevC [Cognatiyoonia sp. IB215446]MDX8348942.1 ABC transporter permease DevC [Cognatiyoonia sp. IB215446]